MLDGQSSLHSTALVPITLIFPMLADLPTGRHFSPDSNSKIFFRLHTDFMGTILNYLQKIFAVFHQRTADHSQKVLIEMYVNGQCFQVINNCESAAKGRISHVTASEKYVGYSLHSWKKSNMHTTVHYASCIFLQDENDATSLIWFISILTE